MPKDLSTTSSVKAFLAASKQHLPSTQAQDKAKGRLLFAMDATASREASWSMACQIQSDMFAAAAGLEISLCYYRGIGEFHTFPWSQNSTVLQKQMRSVCCLAGHTQIGQVLRHAVSQGSKQKMKAVVLVADCFEESIDTIAHDAARLGLLGIPLFIFQEGYNSSAEKAFRHLSQLSNGAYCRFDENSLAQLRELLAAVASYAVGGVKALQQHDQGKNALLKQLIKQLPAK